MNKSNNRLFVTKTKSNFSQKGGGGKSITALKKKRKVQTEQATQYS